MHVFYGKYSPSGMSAGENYLCSMYAQLHIYAQRRIAKFTLCGLIQCLVLFEMYNLSTLFYLSLWTFQVRRISQADVNTEIVFNCQMGRGRTTTGMVIATLVYLNRIGASGTLFCSLFYYSTLMINVKLWQRCCPSYIFFPIHSPFGFNKFMEPKFSGLQRRKLSWLK